MRRLRRHQLRWPRRAPPPSEPPCRPEVDSVQAHRAISCSGGEREGERPEHRPLARTGQYQDTDTGLYYLRARFYDPATGQFSAADPLVGITGQPYTYAQDNPLNLADPSGLFSLDPSHLIHYALDVIAVPPYAAYYASYEVTSKINGLACSVSSLTCGASHLAIAATPLPLIQTSGLADDATLDLIKNKATGNGESVYDEDICGGILPRFIDNGGPRTFLPGLSKNPDGSDHVDFAW